MLPACLAHSRDLAFESEKPEYVSAEAELAIDALPAACYEATVADTCWRAVAGKLLKPHHVACRLEFGTLCSVLLCETDALLISSYDGSLGHEILVILSRVYGMGTQTLEEARVLLRLSLPTLRT